MRLAGQTWKILLCLALFAGTIDLVNHLLLLTLGIEGSLSRVIIRVGIWWISYVPLLACALVLADRYRLDGDERHRNLAIHILTALAFAYCHTAANALLDPQWLTGSAPFLPRVFRNVRGNFPIDFVSYWTIVGSTYAFHYYSEVHRRALAAEQLKTTAAQLEASLTEARLTALRAQLNPHFLFNTLNAVSALALKNEPRAVVRTLSKLSDLLRISLDEDRPQLITLAKELEFIESYIEVQRLWFGDRVNVERMIPLETLNALVPTMILQPLIENAFVHGIAKSSGPARVRIEAATEGRHLRLTVTDSGNGFRSAAVPRFGIGLSNTQARLKQLYGAEYEMICGQTAERCGLVTLRFPYANEREAMTA
jgi:histidine kinase/histidine kinase/DNA gyrase B/HSP90-like ATPase